MQLFYVTQAYSGIQKCQNLNVNHMVSHHLGLLFHLLTLKKMLPTVRRLRRNAPGMDSLPFNELRYQR